MITIMFDETCAGWSKNSDYNRLFLTMNRDYLNEKLRYRGYVYLNEIYESMGAKWNPDDDNLCYRIECGDIEMKFEPAEYEVYLVKVY